MKDLFNVKATTEIPPLQSFENGRSKLAFSDTDKIETLNKYFSSISILNLRIVHYPIYTICVIKIFQTFT